MKTKAILAFCFGLAICAQEPKTAAEWQQLAIKQHSEGHYREAAENFQKAIDAGAPKITRYNLSCALARLGESDRAMSILTTMVENGATLPLATDKDLASLRERADFRALIARMQSNAEPCKDPQRHPEFRTFDFWIGEWDVFNRAGTKVGDSRIDLILKDCTILENWTGTAGGSGKSFNSYNPLLKKWQQFWTADAGNTIYFVGEGGNGVMRLRADAKANGLPSDRRLTFTKLPEGKVRQHSERSTPDGWTTEYDFTYVPKKR